MSHLLVCLAQSLDLRSVHFLPFPMANESLIDSGIEAAVAKMQTVIELGRVIRDRNTMPIKYPLKEVIVVMESEEALKDVEVSWWQLPLLCWEFWAW